MSICSAVKNRKPPICSIVIPVHNAEQYIIDAIESVKQQTVKPLEIIVINDHCRDNSIHLVRNYDPEILIVNCQKRGASAARNRGIDIASSEFIAFLDADDICHPKRIEFQIGAFSKNPNAAMVFSAMAYIDHNGQQIGKAAHIHNFDPSALSGKLFVRNRIGSTSVAMVKRDVLNKSGGFDEKLAFNEEYDLWLRIALDFEIQYIDKALIYYRLHKQNISRFKKQQQFNETMALNKHSTNVIKSALIKAYRTNYSSELAYARVLFRLRRYHESENCLNQLKQSGFDHPTLHFYLGNLFLIKGGWN